MNEWLRGYKHNHAQLVNTNLSFLLDKRLSMKTLTNTSPINESKRRPILRSPHKKRKEKKKKRKEIASPPVRTKWTTLQISIWTSSETRPQLAKATQERSCDASHLESSAGSQCVDVKWLSRSSFCEQTNEQLSLLVRKTVGMATLGRWGIFQRSLVFRVNIIKKLILFMFKMLAFLSCTR